MERLQRVIAARGISSRRSAEVLITGGRVLVNGVAVTELGTRVDPTADEIRVDGKVIRPQRLRTILLNKPPGYITTMADDRERRTVMELIDIKERLFPVGRLDRDTEGMLLLTNDGELANRIMHPRYRLAKEYHVLTDQRPTDRTLQYLRDGVRIDDRDVVPDEIRLLRETPEGIWIRLVIHEGFYHAVRRIMEAASINVIKLRRHRIGPLTIKGLEAGEYRDLTMGELSQISEAVHMDRDIERSSPAPAAPRLETDTPAARSGPRTGRRRMTSDRPDAGQTRGPQGPRDWSRRPAPTNSRPAAPARPGATPPANPPRSPIVERPGAWSARRPENPPPRPGSRPAVSSQSGPGTEQSNPSQPAAAAGSPVPRAARPVPPTSPPGADGRFETVGGQRFSEVRRTFTSERPSGEATPQRPVRRPTPQRSRRDDATTGQRSESTRSRPASTDAATAPTGPPARREDGPVGPRRDQPSMRPQGEGALSNEPRRDGVPVGPPRDGSPTGPRRAGASAGPRRDGPASGPRPRVDRSRPAARPDASRETGRADDRRQRPTAAPETERRPPADRGPRLLTQRRSPRPDAASGAPSRKLETVGRVSRKVESDNPDEGSSRIKRRSPHSHSHRGAKPKPAAPRINTSKGKSVRKTQGKGTKRGRRR